MFWKTLRSESIEQRTPEAPMHDGAEKACREGQVLPRLKA